MVRGKNKRCQNEVQGTTMLVQNSVIPIDLGKTAQNSVIPIRKPVQNR